MRQKINLLLLLLALFCKQHIYAQKFEPLNSSYYTSSLELVDTLMETGEPLIIVKDDGTKIYHYQQVVTPQLKRGSQNVMKGTIDKNGKVETYLEYENPFIYYVIAEFPESDGRYYGLYTPSYSDIFDIQNNKTSDLHPLGFSGPVLGTMVYNNGKKDKVIGRKPYAANKDKISKPTGTYKLVDFENLEYIEFTFNVGGNGKVKFVRYPLYEPIIAEVGGSANVKIPGTNRRQNVRSYKGGYTIIKDLIVTGDMKWNLSSDGELNIELVGKPTIKTPIRIDWSELDKTTVFTQKSDRQTLIAQREEDMKTNEHVIKAREIMRERGKDLWDEFSKFTFECYHIGKESIIGLWEGHSGFYVLEKNQNYNQIDQTLRHSLEYVAKFGTNRKYGVEKRYEDFVNRGKRAIEKHPEFSSASEYYVTDINPVERTGKIQYVSNNKVLISPISFDSNWQLMEIDINSIVENMTLNQLYNQINFNNEAIKAYEKDKLRKKVVKEYEKKFKKFVMPTQFNSLTEFNDLVKNANDIIELQNYYIEYLK